MIPHGRGMVPRKRGFLRLNPKIPMESVRRTMTGRSRVKTSDEKPLNGDVAPLVPTTATEFKKFEPIMLPSISSFCPRRVEAKADASSGSDVPAAMTVSPISSSETPNERERPTAPRQECAMTRRVAQDHPRAQGWDGDIKGKPEIEKARDLGASIS